MKKAPLNVNYYLENTTTSLAPSENQADLPVKSDYTTQAKTIEPKTEVQDLPEKTVTTVTTYELVSTPDNANGKITEGGTTVNYFYRAVVKTTEVAKQAPVTANYYLEGTTDKLAPSDEQGQKDIGSDYTTEAKAIPDKVEVQDLDDRVITKTTSYELVAEPTDKEGTVPVGGKVVNYYYREVVKEVAKPNEAPKVEIPEFNGGVVPLDPPVVDIPELKIPEEFKPEPKPEPTPEPKPAPTPQPAPAPQPVPQPEPSPAPNPVPVTPETPEQPVAPVTPEQPAEPATPQYMDGQRELPNTGTEDHASLAALGLLGALSGFGLIARKKREDEE